MSDTLDQKITIEVLAERVKNNHAISVESNNRIFTALGELKASVDKQFDSGEKRMDLISEECDAKDDAIKADYNMKLGAVKNKIVDLERLPEKEAAKAYKSFKTLIVVTIIGVFGSLITYMITNAMAKISGG